MYASKYHLNTLKEAPAEAEVISHQLMTRAGILRKIAGGIYTYMPMGLKVLRKIENIVREEMNRANAIEILMPIVQPAELWQESGRWDDYGAELLRIKDRNQRDFVIQPTSEEVITDIVRNEIHSWRQLPVNFYHIQTKFRDERRPRFGLMRGREFTMKDAYSFDRDEASAQQSYDAMYKAYQAIFTRIGLNFRAVAADTGSIGGSRSHEFQVIADTGEDLIVYNPDTEYAANIELADAPCLIAKRSTPNEDLVKAATPDSPKCELVAQFLNQPLEKTIKSIVIATETEGAPAKIWLLLIRGDHESNEIKINKIPGLDQGYRMATESEILAAFNTKPGYIGPVGINKDITVVADLTVANMADFICGANEEGFHYTGVNWVRDLPEPNIVADIRNVVAGDPAPNGGKLAIQRGIEVGHVFFLGDKYSKALNASFLDADGKPTVIQMGCYGIGISRISAAAIEQNHDDKGMIWPKAIAPFEVVICPIGYHKSELVKATADKLYEQLAKLNVDLILDDRNTRPGAMFADWDLIGVPLRITLGERSLKENVVEIQTRKNGTTQNVNIESAVEQIQSLLQNL